VLTVRGASTVTQTVFPERLSAVARLRPVSVAAKSSCDLRAAIGAWCSSDLPVLPLESAPVSRHRRLPPSHARPQRGVVCGDGLATLSLEPVAVRRVPRRRPRCPSTARRRAVLAVGSRTTSTTVGDRRAAGGTDLHPMNTSPGRPVFSVGAPREIFSFVSRVAGDGCDESRVTMPSLPLPTLA